MVKFRTLTNGFTRTNDTNASTHSWPVLLLVEDNDAVHHGEQGVVLAQGGVVAIEPLHKTTCNRSTSA